MDSWLLIGCALIRRLSYFWKCQLEIKLNLNLKSKNIYYSYYNLLIAFKTVSVYSVLRY